MGVFAGDDFLLHGDTAKRLYHESAAGQPIFDYHSHLDPMEIYNDRPYDNLAQLWLFSDHYKWRAMRAAGVEERLITGDAPDKEKFTAWAHTLPKAMGNPLYHWTHLELQRYFGIREPLGPESAEQIWEQANAVIRGKKLSPRKLLGQMNVRQLCTTDDITGSLEAHRLLQKDMSLGVRVYPTFRLDPLLDISAKTVGRYLESIACRVRGGIENLTELFDALSQIMDEYDALNCRTSDHGVYGFPTRQATEREAEAALRRIREGYSVSGEELGAFRSVLLFFLFGQYRKRGWVAQIHIGSLRNGNSRVFHERGAAMGCDAMLDEPVALALNLFLDRLNTADALPRVLLYHINPVFSDALAAVAANFNNSEIPSRIQLGPAWWLADHKDGIEEQLRVFARNGLLGEFVGMLTDSRSFLSFPRHEYFRRILCNLIGGWVDDGEFPDAMPLLNGYIKKICYDNAVRFFSVTSV